jgi:hypothetical protein
MARSPGLDRLNFRDQICPLDSRLDIEAFLKLPYTKVIQLNDAFQYRPALLASYYYGTPDFWWVILDYNQLTWTTFTVGRIIKLPEISLLRQQLRATGLRQLIQRARSGQTTQRYRLPRRRIVV